MLPQATADALATMRPARIVALGGPTAVSDAVLDAASAAAEGAATDRLAGADRFATAVAIAGLASSNDVVFVATGTNFPDALAAAPVAAARGAGLVLTGTHEIPAATRTHLEALAPREVVVLGGPVAVSQTVADALEELTGGDP